MKIVKLICLIALSIGAMNAFANELDPTFQTPEGVIVRENEKGVKEVFKAALGEITNNVTAESAVKEFVKPENAISNVTPGSELDLTSSDEQWHSWNSSCYYSNSYSHSWDYSPYYYSYGCQGVSHYYYPTYSWQSGGYSYTYHCHSYYEPYHYYPRHRW